MAKFFTQSAQNADRSAVNFLLRSTYAQTMTFGTCSSTLLALRYSLITVPFKGGYYERASLDSLFCHYFTLLFEYTPYRLVKRCRRVSAKPGMGQALCALWHMDTDYHRFFYFFT